ncbi:hypothetical protein J6590_040098 [Homalodisca vitripennis]|nr:hypothetical protein J6590_040098 [Homalodisca vitripennis]
MFQTTTMTIRDNAYGTSTQVRKEGGDEGKAEAKVWRIYGGWTYPRSQALKLHRVIVDNQESKCSTYEETTQNLTCQHYPSVCLEYIALNSVLDHELNVVVRPYFPSQTASIILAIDQTQPLNFVSFYCGKELDNNGVTDVSCMNSENNEFPMRLTQKTTLVH